MTRYLQNYKINKEKVMLYNTVEERTWTKKLWVNAMFSFSEGDTSVEFSIQLLFCMEKDKRGKKTRWDLELSERGNATSNSQLYNLWSLKSQIHTVLSRTQQEHAVWNIFQSAMGKIKLN